MFDYSLIIDVFGSQRIKSAHIIISTCLMGNVKKRILKNKYVKIEEMFLQEISMRVLQYQS